MNRGILLAGVGAIVALALSTSGGTAARADAMASQPAPTVVMPSAIKWQPVQGMAGLESAVLYGDPTKAGSVYVMRYKVSDGFKFPAHSHPMLEEVTVLSGTFEVGLGDTFDASKMTALPAGSYVAIPAKLNHYGQAKGEVVLELHGVGPYSIDMVKP
jgi:quercetin dioxygenase-like cupin family protein